MARLPFDPKKMAAPTALPSTANAAIAADAPFTVSQIASRIDASLRSGVPSPIRVIGEISGFRDRTHWYFDLKDAQAVVSCAMWQSQSKRLGFTLTNGQQVVVRGRLEFYAPGGKVTLVCDRVEPVGAGALELAYRQLVEEIRALGWTSPDRKRPVPRFPRKIAIITSRSAAALQDVLVTMRKRCPAVGVLLADVRVQGDKAAAEVADAIRTINANRARLGVDAILITRGGGSMEDLWAFNDRSLAQTIVESHLPIVAAIGHETDTTIAELVADERCATPTQAAMRLTPDGAALERQVESLARRASSLARRHIDFASQQLIGACRSRLIAEPHTIIAHAAAQLDSAQQRTMRSWREVLFTSQTRLSHARQTIAAHHPRSIHATSHMQLAAAEARVKAAWLSRDDAQRIDRTARALHDIFTSRLRDAATHLTALERHLTAINPNAVLDRGYTLTRLDDGSLLRDASRARPGQTLTTTAAIGSVQSTVTGTPDTTTTSAANPAAVREQPKPGIPMPPAPKRRSSSRNTSRDSGGPGLFG